jgi:glycosyltransferase involved in cell wall biosynthesis
MKLIYLTVATIPNKTAHSKYVMKLCEAFKNQKVDVTIISGKSFDDQTVLNISNIRLSVKENKYKSLILACFHFLFILKRKIFFQSKKDIYIVHNAMSAIACSILRVNYIIDMHSKIFNNNKAKKILFKHLPKFWIVQSNLLKNFVNKDIGIDEENILLSRNAISEVKNFIRIDKFLEHDSRLKFGYIGSLEPNRGFGDFIKLFESNYDEYIIYVAGDYYRFKTYYDNIINSMEKKPNIIFLGFLDDEEINYICQNVDILLTLYTTKISTIGYASPMKIFEYLRFNKRIIAPKIPDIEEIIKYYDCEDRMRWYDIDNVISLKNTIEKVLREDKNQTFKSVQVETWDDKAKNILERIKIENKTN